MDIIADADQMERELKRAQRSVRDAERRMESFGMSAERESRRFDRLRRSLSGVNGRLQVIQRNWLAVGAAVGATEGARRVIGGMISAASDLEESVSKVNVVFGASATGIRSWADEAAGSMGLSTQAALESAGTFGNLFTAMGLTQGAAAGLSEDVVQLAVDFASFNNIGTAEALEKLRAGLVGEAEPLRALGVNISAAAVENKALELGLARTKAELDDSAKVLARWALITEQSTNAAGDFERTSEGLANQQRILAANMADLETNLGRFFVPAMTEATEKANDLFDALEDITGLAGQAHEFVMNIRLTGADEKVGSGELTVGDLFGAAFAGTLRGPGGAKDLIGGAIGSVPGFDAARIGVEAGLSIIPQAAGPPRIGGLEQAAAAAEAGMGFGELAPTLTDFVNEVLAGGPDISQQAGAMETARRQRERESGGAGGGPDAFSPAALSFIESQLSGLPTFDFDLSEQGVEDFRRAQQAFDDTRKSLRTMAAGIGLDLAELDAVGLENTNQFAALQEQLDAVNETLKRTDLIEGLQLDPFRDQIDDLAESLREAREAAKELAAAERDRATQNVHNLARAIIEGANQGADVSGALDEFNRQSRIAAGLPEQGSGPFTNAGGQTVVLQVSGDLNVDTSDGGQIPALDELLR